MRNRELNILYFDRNDYLENHPIKTGSTSYASKKGCEAVDSCYEVLYEVLNMSEASPVLSRVLESLWLRAFELFLSGQGPVFIAEFLVCEKQSFENK